MIVTCYLVIGPGRSARIKARRVTQQRPPLDANEAMVKLRIELPDDVMEAPLVTVPIERREIAVAVEAEAPLEDVPA